MPKTLILVALATVEASFQLVALPLFFMAGGCIIAQELGFDVVPSLRLFLATFIFTSMPYLYRLCSADLAHRAAAIIAEQQMEEFTKLMDSFSEKKDTPKDE